MSRPVPLWRIEGGGRQPAVARHSNHTSYIILQKHQLFQLTVCQCEPSLGAAGGQASFAHDTRKLLVLLLCRAAVMAQALFRKYDAVDDGNCNNDFCILSQMSSSASMKLGSGSLLSSAQTDGGFQGTQQMQLPGLQMASCIKYSHLFYLSEVEDDGTFISWQASVVYTLCGICRQQSATVRRIAGTDAGRCRSTSRRNFKVQRAS